MTERREEGFGSGPGGLVFPEDLDPDVGSEAPELLAKPAYEGPMEARMTRVEALLLELGRKVPTRADFERLLERSSGKVETGLQDLSLGLAELERVQSDLARKFEVEDVLANQKREFAFFRESHAWLRGAATVGAPAPRPDAAPRSRAGVAVLYLLWALTVAAAFGAGAVAFGGLRVDVAWEARNARPAAAAPTLRYGGSLNERRREQVAAERHIDFVEPANAGRPVLGPAPDNTRLKLNPAEGTGTPVYGQGAPALPPRHGPSVAEPGTP